jgi:hypothetical protein
LPALPALTFSISCMGPTQVAWRIVDNRSDSSYFQASTINMGLGRDKDGNKIGSYQLMMSSPILDGNAAYVMYSSGDWSYWDSTSGTGRAGLNPALMYSYSKSGIPNTLDKGSVFSAAVNITTTIAPKSTLNTSDEIDLDGSSTINLSYL